MPALRRSKTGLWSARKVIPADVREAYGKREEKKTWPSELSQGQAKAELAAWLTLIEERISQLRAVASQASVTLSQRQVRALAGEWYKTQAASFEENPGEDHTWWFAADDEVELFNPDETDRPDKGWTTETLRQALHVDPDQPLAVRVRRDSFLFQERDRLVSDKGMKLSPQSADALLREMVSLWLDLCRLMERRAQGDYGPDPLAETLPSFEGTLDEKQAAVSIMGQFDEYAQSGAANPKTLRRWRNALQSLVDFLGHDDAMQVTRSDANAWLSKLVADGLSVRTVRATYRAVASRIFKLAYNAEKVSANPFDRLEVLGPKPTATRRKDISDGEAKTILRATLEAQPEGISEAHARARRWVPWICAYTGARVNEIAQMRAMDIRQEDGVWVFRITPEAGSVKDRRARSVPIHSHLIEQGITTLAKEDDASPLFYQPRPDGGSKTNPPNMQMGTALAKWVRGLGVTEVQSPNHGWRHRFKTQARRIGIPEDARDAIQGHAPKSQGQAYGEWPLEALRAEVEKLPVLKPR